jgi:ornithine cyclodeaminase/alanine dehydrogenase-like protein (mu-crystallin family)
MTGAVLRLRAYEVWSALEVIDPVAVLAEDLIGRSIDRSGHPRKAPGRLVPWAGAGRSGSELVQLDHPEATLSCVASAHSLRTSLAASLAAMAARKLLAPGGVTVAMLGSAEATQPQLSVIARHVPDISHVALWLDGGKRRVEPKLVDQLELSGIGLSVVPTLADAVFGANLVVATNQNPAGQELSTLRLGQLAHDAVLVNATGKDLPARLVDQVDEVFVDDFGLLGDHRERRVVAAHLGEPTPRSGVGHGTGPRITADLAQLLTGQHPGRTRSDGVALIELLGVHELNAELAYRVYEGAMRTGLGVRVDNGDN